jgi:hypothetical protein
MRKLMLIVLSFCFLFGMATRAEEDVKEEAKLESAITGQEASPVMEAYDPLIKPEEEPALYKTQINQITPSSGIKTGHVIAYGHYIKPPYKVEVREDTLLFLNGMRIYPPLPSKIRLEETRREREKYKEAVEVSEPYRKRLRALFDNAQELYKVIAPKIGKEAAVDSICKLLKKDSLMVDVKVGSQGKEYILLELKYYLPGLFMPPEDPLEELLELRMHSPKSTPTINNEERLKRKKSSVVRMKERAEKDLGKGHVLMTINVSVCWNVLFEMHFWRIVRVLKDTNKTFNEKLEKLCGRDIGLIEDGAKELLYNYNPNEWPELEEEK